MIKGLKLKRTAHDSGINLALDTWAGTHMSIVERILGQLVQCGKPLISCRLVLEQPAPAGDKRCHHIYCGDVHVATLTSSCSVSVSRGITLSTRIKTYPDGRPSGWPIIYAEP